MEEKRKGSTLTILPSPPFGSFLVRATDTETTLKLASTFLCAITSFWNAGSRRSFLLLFKVSNKNI